MAWTAIGAFKGYGDVIYYCQPSAEIDELIRQYIALDGRIDLEYTGASAWDHLPVMGNVSPGLSDDFLSAPDITAGTYGNPGDAYSFQYIQEGFAVRFKDHEKEGHLCRFGLGIVTPQTGWPNNWYKCYRYDTHDYLSEYKMPFFTGYDTVDEVEETWSDMDNLFNGAVYRKYEPYLEEYYNPDTQTTVNRYTTDSSYTFNIYIYINEAEQLAVPIIVETKTETSGGWPVVGKYDVWIYQKSYYTETMGAILYEMLTPYTPGPQEDWTAISSVTGGGFTTQLAMLKDSSINDGNSVLDGTLDDIARLFSSAWESPAYISSLLMLREQGDVVEKFIMSGGNYINATIDSKTNSYEFTYTLDFYLADDTLIYSHQYTVNHDDHYLSAIRKEGMSEVARPSMIITNGTYYRYNTEGDFDETTDANLYNWFIGSGENPDPFGDDITTDEQEGGTNFFPRPTFDFTEDMDYNPTDEALETGFFHAYALGKDELGEFGQTLWSSSAWDTLKKYYATPSDAIMALFRIPFDGFYDSDNKVPIRLGDIQTTTDMAYDITERYPEFDFGDVKIKPESDTYIDLQRYTRIWIYIPIIGEKEIDTQWCMLKYKEDKNHNTKIDGKGLQGSVINLKMKVDVLTGTCIAKVYINGVMRYQFVGDCHEQIPYSWQTHQAALSQTASTVGAIGGLAAGAIGGLAVGGPLGFLIGAGAGLIGTAVETAKLSAAVQAGGQIRHQGAVGALATALSWQYPYITITYPNTIEVEHHKHFIGNAKPVYQKIGAHTGLVKFSVVHLEDVVATDEEKTEAERILREGVIINAT